MLFLSAALSLIYFSISAVYDILFVYKLFL